MGGLASFFKGLCLSFALNKVRLQKLNKGFQSSSHMKSNSLSLTHFKTELLEYDMSGAQMQTGSPAKKTRRTTFSDTDLMYIMRGLSSDPDPIMDLHKITLKAEDLDQWKSIGRGRHDMSL